MTTKKPKFQALAQPELGQWLKARRLERGLGLSEFARRLGKDKSNVAGIENQGRSMFRDPDLLIQIAELLGIGYLSDDWLVLFRVPLEARKFAEIVKSLKRRAKA